MIPLNQKVKVYLSDEGSDKWGIPVKTDDPTTYKVRLDFNSQADVVRSGYDGNEIVYKATLYFKGAIPLTYQDFVEYDSGTNGMVKSNPKVIFPITDLAGKVTYTKVII